MPTFDEFKQRVSIIQILEDLGFVRDKSKGKTQPEYYKLDGHGNKNEDIVLKNPQSANELYFNRNDSRDNGDLISFVKNRLSDFPQFSHSNDMVRVNMILGHYANITYVPRTAEYERFNTKEPFNRDEFTEKKPDVQGLKYLTAERKISPKTVEAFLPFITTVHDNQGKGNFYNVAFPYTRPGSDEITNYELRNYGFKGMARNGNKTESLWMATNAERPETVKNIYLFESALDAMSYYELHKSKVSLQDSVFASIGGYVSPKQITGIVEHYANAKVHTGFDSDANGHLYDIKVACLLAGKELQITQDRAKENYSFEVNGKKFSIGAGELSLNKFKALSGLRPDMKVHKAPGEANDFNEVLKNSESNGMGVKR